MGKGTGAGAVLDASGLTLAIVAASYNADIVELLLSGAHAAWRRHGGRDAALTVTRVPGAFELPLAALTHARRGADAVVALGCVIRGETAHFDYVCEGATHGLQRVMLDTGVPVGFGLLTTDNHAQALERAAPGRGDKGAEALETALHMALWLRRDPPADR